MIKNNITQENLLDEINNLDEITHRHSIIAIKNTFDKFSNKFLTYYDKRWDCDFFINYKSVENMETVIKEKLSNEFKINKDKILVEFKGNAIQRKYSMSDQINKIYDHSFYLVTILEFNDIEKNNTFTLDTTQYTWLSIHEMKENQNTVSKNLDVINKIDELIQ